MLDSNHAANLSSATLERAMPQETEPIELQTVQPTSTSNTTSTHHGIQDDETIPPTARPQPKVRDPSDLYTPDLVGSGCKCPFTDVV